MTAKSAAYRVLSTAAALALVVAIVSTWLLLRAWLRLSIAAQYL